jgi:hypothetical protein
MGSQVVDTTTASEFMAETMAKVSTEELGRIVALLETKSARFSGPLAERGGARTLGTDELRGLLRNVFSARRKADLLLSVIGPDRLAGAIDDLLHGPRALPERVLAFDDVVHTDFPDPGFDLPGELLHFTFPDRYWLWSRWMWDPRTETGALTLVTADDYDLYAPGRGEAYVRVGEAVTFVNETGRQVGFTALGGAGRTDLFGVDVFLACVYSVYMYTVLRLRMTQEFNKIVPELPDLVRRLLGVHRLALPEGA